MAENQSNPPSQQPPDHDPSNQPAPASPPKKRKKRWWLRIVLMFLLLIILLVVFAPTIISTGVVRNFVVGKINDQLLGRVAIANWSVGWTSGVELNGVRVKDAQGRTIFEAPKVTADVPFSSAARGEYPVTLIAENISFDLRVDKNRQINFAQLMKPSPAAATTRPASAASGPFKLPPVSLDMLITGRGTIEQEGQAPIFISDAKITGNLKGTNEPLYLVSEAKCRIGDAKDGTVKFSATVDAVKENQIDLKTPTAKVELHTQDLPLASLRPFLPPIEQLQKLAGLTNVNMTVDVDGRQAVLAGDVRSIGFAVGGPPVPDGQGGTIVETFSSDLLVTIPPTVMNLPADPADYPSTRLKLGASPEQPMTILLSRADKSEQIKITAYADATVQTLMNVAAQKAPGGEGLIKATASANLAKLAADMPRTFAMVEGKTLTGGVFTAESVTSLTPQKVATAQKLAVTGLAARDKDGKTIEVAPMSFALSAATVGDSRGRIPNVQDILLELDTGKDGFATGRIEGKSLAQVRGNLHAELGKLQQQLGQVFDFKGRTLAGQVDVVLANTGNVEQEAGVGNFSATSTLAGIRVVGLTEKPIDIPILTADASAKIVRGSGNEPSVKSVDDVNVSVVGGPKDAPTLKVLATANVRMRPLAGPTTAPASEPVVPQFAVTEFFVDMARAEQQYGPLVPQLQKMKIALGEGIIRATASGSYAPEKAIVDVTQLVVRNGPESAPTIDLAATAKIEKTGDTIAVPAFNLTRAMLDVGKAEQQFGGAVPQLKEMNLKVGSGVISAVASGSFDGSTANVTLSKAEARLGDAGAPMLDLSADAQVVVEGVMSREMKISAPTANLSKFSADLPRLRKQFASIIKLPEGMNLDLTSGTIVAAASATFDGTTLTIKSLSVAPKGLTIAKTRLKDYSTEMKAAGTVVMGADAMKLNFTTLSLDDAGKLLKVSANKPLVVTMGKDKFAAEADMQVAADVKAALDIVSDITGKPVEITVEGKKGKLDSAKLDGAITSAVSEATGTTIGGALNLTGITISDTTGKIRPVDNESINLNLGQIAVAKDFSKVQLKGQKVTGSLVSATITSATVNLPASAPAGVIGEAAPAAPPMDVWNMVPEASGEVSVPNVSKLITVATAMMPPAPATRPVAKATPKPKTSTPTPAPTSRRADDLSQWDRPRRDEEPPATPAGTAKSAAEESPLPPLTLSDGVLTKATFNIRREGQLTRANVAIDGDRFAITRGQGYYKAGAVKAGGDLVIDAATAADKSIIEQIREIRVEKFAVKSQLGNIDVQEPISIKSLATTPQASGKVSVNGKLQPVMELLAAIGAKPDKEAMPYFGDVAMIQTLSTVGGVISLKGDGAVTKFAAKDKAGKTVFSEDRIAIGNDVSMESKTNPNKTTMLTLGLNKVSLDMESSKAAAVTVTGAIKALGDADGVNLVRFLTAQGGDGGIEGKLSYDAEKVVAALKPFLDSPTLKDLVVKGVGKDLPFKISGAYPLSEEFNKAITSVDFSAQIAMQLLEFMGAEVKPLEGQSIDLWVTLSEGKAGVPEKIPGQDRRVRAMGLNGGSLRLAGVYLDLTGPSPHLNAPAGKLMNNVAVNPLFVSTFLAPVAPLFTGANKASGKLDLDVKEFKDVPLSWLMPAGEDAPKKLERGGRAEVVLNLEQYQIGNDVTTQLIKLTGRDKALIMEIKDAKVVIENGIVKSDVPFAIDNNTLRFTGDVNVPRGMINTMNMGLPKAFLKNIKGDFGNKILPLLPENISVPFTGKFTAPQFDFMGAITKNVGAGLLQGGGDNPAKGIEDLLKGLGGDSKKPKKK